MSDRLIKVAVMIVVPTMACFGYYTQGALPESKSAWAIPAVLAYPAAVIGVIGWVAALRPPRRSRRVLVLWALCVAVPSVLLLWLRA